MKQLVLEFAAEVVAAAGVPLDAKTRDELVARMAEAILAVIEAEGGRSDERPRSES